MTDNLITSNTLAPLTLKGIAAPGDASSVSSEETGALHTADTVQITEPLKISRHITFVSGKRLEKAGGKYHYTTVSDYAKLLSEIEEMVKKEPEVQGVQSEVNQLRASTDNITYIHNALKTNRIMRYYMHPDLAGRIDAVCSPEVKVSPVLRGIIAGGNAIAGIATAFSVTGGSLIGTALYSITPILLSIILGAKMYEGWLRTPGQEKKLKKEIEEQYTAVSQRLPEAEKQLAELKEKARSRILAAHVDKVQGQPEDQTKIEEEPEFVSIDGIRLIKKREQTG